MKKYIDLSPPLDSSRPRLLTYDWPLFQFARPIFDVIDKRSPAELKKTLINSTYRNTFYKDKTALFYAVSKGISDEEIKLLCSFDDVDINKGDRSGSTPLAEAARLNKADIVKVLLGEPGIDVNKANSSGSTPLSEAVALENDDVIKLLCKDDQVAVKHENWNTREKQEEMFESPCFYPLLVRMAQEGCNKFDISKCNTSRGDSMVHMAVIADQDAGIEFLCAQENIDFNAIDNDGNTAFDLIFRDNAPVDRHKYSSIVQIAHKIGGKDVVRRKDSIRRTVLDLALEIDQEKIDVQDSILFFLAQPGLEIERYKLEGGGIYHILKDIASEKGIDDHYLSETRLPEGRLNNIPYTLVKLFETADDENSIIDDLRGKIDSEACARDEKMVYEALINISLIGLQQYADHERLQYILYKGSVFKIFVQIFVNLDDEKFDDLDYLAQLLRVLYISMQANIKCDCIAMEEEKFVPLEGDRVALRLPGNLYELESLTSCKGTDTAAHRADYAVFARSLINTLGESLQSKLREKIKEVSKVGENSGELNDVQLIAKGIHEAYFEDTDKKGCFKSFKRNVVKRNGCLTSWTKQFFHKCICRSEFAFLLCLLSIFFHVSDIVSDGVVGFKTLNGFSKRLGILMITLVLLTLVHENIRSVISAYETEKELLRISLGKIELSRKDFDDKSDLNYYEDCNFRLFKYLGRFLWTYKVKWSTTEKMKELIRPLLFNCLSVLMLRPIVDRLIVLTHQPSHLRAIYRQQSKQKSLNQYYMILEQIPELLIQFYVFQIYFNNLETPEHYTNFGCKETHRFTYEVTYFVCVENLAKLKICTTWWEIYSMLVPFVKIPSSMVSLEEMFRKLSPETPKMSTAASWSLYLAYIIMIPSRLFLFAAVMHSAPDHFYVAAYMGLITFVWLTINILTMIGAEKTREKEEKKNRGISEKEKSSSVILKYSKTIWSLLLFTMRDVMLVSLRRTDAYLLPSSEVSYKTLRTWKEVLAISSYFFIEGVVGAVYVERYYPCGRNTEIFKYQGWLYLALLIISVTMMTLLAYILQPTKINIIPRLYPHRAFTICSCGIVMWFVAAATLNFTTTNSRADVLLPLVVTTLVLILILSVIVVVLRFFSEAKQKDKRDKDLEDEKRCSPKFLSCLSCFSKQGPKMERITELGEIITEGPARKNTKEKKGCKPATSEGYATRSNTEDDRQETTPMLQV